nr:hypothetical protein [Cellulosimicrobium sp. MM]
MTITQISRRRARRLVRWDVVPLPAGPAGQQNVIGQAGIGSSRRGAPDVAADFLAWFTNPENAETLAAYFPPPRESLYAETLGRNPSSARSSSRRSSSRHPGRVTSRRTRLRQAAGHGARQLDALWTADADVEGVLADTCAAIQPLLGD